MDGEELAVPAISTKERLDLEKIHSLELANKELEGALVRRDAVERQWTEWMVEFRSQVEAMPAQLASNHRFNATQMAAVRKQLDGMVKSLEKFSGRQKRKTPAKGASKSGLRKDGKVRTRRASGKVSVARQKNMAAKDG